MKTIILSLLILISFKSQSQALLDSSGNLVNGNQYRDTPTVVSLIAPLYNPTPSNRRDSAWNAIKLNYQFQVDSSKALSLTPTSFFYGLTATTDGQKIFTFPFVPKDINNFLVTKNKLPLEPIFEFTILGNSVMLKTGVISGTRIAIRRF